MPRKRFAQPMFSIHERDFDPADRSTAGNWEGDLIIGKGQRSAIGTLVERKSRYVKLLHLGWRDSTSLHQAIVNSMNPLPPHLRLSLTWDQGTEMAQHQEIRRDTNMKVYFCDPASPWQRPSNENTNRLLRQYFPKGTDLSIYSPADLARVEKELNNRPRLVLGDATPEQLFTQMLTLTN